MGQTERAALVTGAAGFVGSRLVERLVATGARPRALVRRGLIAPPPALASAERVYGDVTDAASVAAAVAGCGVVYHCAWGGGSLAESRRVNVDGTVHVLRAAAAAGVRRVVHVSTMAVHGGRLPAELTEECPLAFDGDPYGVSKAEGERAALALGAELGIEVVVLRPTIIYGPGAPLWVRLYLERTMREQLALVDGGESLANVVYVDDVVDAMMAAARVPRVGGHAFLVSGERPVTWREYIGHFARMARKPMPPSVSARRAFLEVQVLRVWGTLTGRPRRLVGMDLSLMRGRTTVRIDKAKRVLGWTPCTSLDAGMARCEAWAQDEGLIPPRGASVTAPREPRVAAASAT